MTMSSEFDLRVRERREHTPWAVVSIERLMREMLWGARQGKMNVTLSCEYRADVDTRTWWTLRWNNVQDAPCFAAAKSLELCLWRAAELLAKQVKQPYAMHVGEESEDTPGRSPGA
jgi:hypothetical protein